MEGSDLKVQWNTHSNLLVEQISQRFLQQQFVDVGLLCEGRTIKCHRLILAACSIYFDQVLSEVPVSDMFLVMDSMKFSELEALVTFMYTGEVTVSQDRLKDFFAAAETLKIKGLSNVVEKPKAARSGEGGGQGLVLNNFSQPKKVRSIAPELVNGETKGISGMELEPRKMPSLLKRPEVGEPNHAGVILPIGLVKRGIGAGKESGVAIIGPFPEVAATTSNAVPRLNGANIGAGFTEKCNKTRMLKDPSPVLLTGTQSGIPLGQFVQTAVQPCPSFGLSTSSTERENQIRLHYTIEPEQNQGLEKAMQQPLNTMHTNQAATEFNIPRMTFTRFMKRQKVETTLPQVEMQCNLLRELLKPGSGANRLNTLRNSARGVPRSSFKTTDTGSNNGANGRGERFYGYPVGGVAGSSGNVFTASKSVGFGVGSGGELDLSQSRATSSSSSTGIGFSCGK